jgi:hypothetical protein
MLFRKIEMRRNAPSWWHFSVRRGLFLEMNHGSTELRPTDKIIYCSPNYVWYNTVVKSAWRFVL